MSTVAVAVAILQGLAHSFALLLNPLRYILKKYLNFTMLDCCSSLTVWTALTAALVAAFIFLSPKSQPGKIAGVYTHPGRFYWLKVVAFYVLMRVRKWKDERDTNRAKDHTKYETYEAGYGTKSKNSPSEMDKIQPLSDHFQAIDAIYFNGANTDGYYIVTATARRPHGVINGFFIITIPGLGTLVTPRFPDTFLFGGTDQFYGAEGLRLEPVTPMKEWKLSYTGELKDYNNPEKKYQVEFNGTWKTDLPYFDYDNMIPPWTMSRAIAKEPWSREYFQMLKEAHQTHYEQHGDLSAQIVVDGKKYVFKTPSMRDHSYGVKRDWKLLHRYIFHMFSTVDGRRFNIGNVCQPHTSSHLELGYIYEKDGSIHAVTSLDLPLWSVGELGTAPTDYGFTFTANNKTWYVQVKVKDTQIFHIGWEWEAKIVERHCQFFVDGVEGQGISECQYRYAGGRPKEYAASDPEFVKTIRTV